jgi:hypothetical protein
MYSLENSNDMWLSRWEGLEKHIEVLKGLVSYINMPRRNVLLATLDGLQDFAAQHFAFFYDGFDPSDPKLSMASSPYDFDFVMRYVIYRIAEDVSVLQQSIDDRQSYIAEALEMADKLAYAALLPAIRQNIVDPKTQALTYFQKRASIRVIPYATIALVAVPLTSLTQWKDLLATFHEVGHFVYWHGIDSHTQTPIQSKVKAVIQTLFPNPPYQWLEDWTEEIFADVYGGLVGGAAIGLNFQHLGNQMSPDEFNGETDEADDHPAPYIRPEIYARVVEWSGKSGLAARLRTHWQEVIRNRPNNPVKTHLNLSVSENTEEDLAVEVKAVEVDHITEVLDRVVQAILEDCLGFHPDQLDQSIHDLADILDSTPVDRIYDEHRYKLTALESSHSQNLDMAPEKKQWSKWVEKKNISVNNPPETGIPYEEWIEILVADGWNSEGPNSGLAP